MGKEFAHHGRCLTHRLLGHGLEPTHIANQPTGHRVECYNELRGTWPIIKRNTQTCEIASGTPNSVDSNLLIRTKTGIYLQGVRCNNTLSSKRDFRGHEGQEGNQMCRSTLLTSALDRGGWSTPRPGSLYPQE